MQDYGYNESRAGNQRIVAWVVVGVVLAVLLGWGIWALNVATSSVRGQGNAIVERNSAENWTQAQAEFEDMYAHIEATDRKITIAKERMDLDPKDATAQENYFGSRTVCQSQVADYNAAARTFLAENFRSADLPEQIDSNNLNTDCKE